MTLRIKELCREKQITMKDIAERLGINPITLSQSLNGNPTLSRLQEVADILEVSVSELFDNPIRNTIFGCLYVNGKPVLVNGKQEVLQLLNTIDGD